MLHTTIQALKEALSKVAPRLAEFSLNEGAPDSEIENFESAVNNTLPEDLKELYREINGNLQEENFGNFFYGMSFYSIDDAIANWNFRKQMGENHPGIKLTHFDDQIDGSDLYNTNWIPIATDGSRCSLCVDLAPAAAGTKGQIIFIEGTDNVAVLVANSTTELLQQFVDDLNSGQYSLATDALEDEQHWLETSDEIDLYGMAAEKTKA